MTNAGAVGPESLNRIFDGAIAAAVTAAPVYFCAPRFKCSSRRGMISTKLHGTLR